MASLQIIFDPKIIQMQFFLQCFFNCSLCHQTKVQVPAYVKHCPHLEI